MQRKFSKRILYLGLDPTRFRETLEPDVHLVHHPIIEIKSAGKDRSFLSVCTASHILLTSRSAVLFFFENLKYFKIDPRVIQKKSFMAVGKATAALLPHAMTPLSEQGEGICDLLEGLQPNIYHVFYPHAKGARPLILQFLKTKAISYSELILYETTFRQDFPSLNLNDFDEVVFTSPSTVECFFVHFNQWPEHLRAKTIGPITLKALEKFCPQQRKICDMVNL